MKKVAVVLFLVLVLAVGGVASAEAWKIGILQFIEHPALDMATQGFIDSLARQGYKDGENLTITILNASGDMATAQMMAERLVTDGNDLLLGVATPAVQALSAATDTIPILGTAVTDYVASALAASDEAPGVNVSGTSDMNPVDRQIQMIQQLVPDCKTIGIIYTSSEVNSEIQAAMAQEEAKKLGLSVMVKTVSAVGDVQQTMEAFIGQIDALYIPTDNICASAIEIIMGIAIPAKLPVIPGEENVVIGGALATVGVNYSRLGSQTGDMALKVLRDGVAVSTLPIERQSEIDICLNQVTANEIGLTFPAELLAAAANVITE